MDGLLGCRAKLGAWLLVIFLVPVTIQMHNFWSVTDPTMTQVQPIMFMRNLATLDVALLIPPHLRRSHEHRRLVAPEEPTHWQ